MRYPSFVCLLLFYCNVAFPQQKNRPVTRILIIFDASNSMYEKYNETTRIETAKAMFAQFADSLQLLKNTEFALRLYGHQKRVPPQDCSDTKLEIPFGKNNLENIKNKIRNLSPKGTTPIARSLLESVDDFPESPGINMIILITDGIEECGGDPCESARRLKEKGIQFRPIIIGLALTPPEIKTLDCVGPYYDMATAGIFSEIIDVIITQTLYVTTAQVNLLDVSGIPSETNVNMTFYDRQTGALMYNYVHTMNSAGNPDTVKIDPVVNYRLVINTIPQVVKDSITLYPGRHNIIAVNAPQGKLTIKTPSQSSLNIRIPGIVRINGNKNTLHVQDINTSEKYLVGNYDLEVLTLPRINIKNIPITQGSNYTVEIPKSGTVKFLSKEAGYGSIFTENDGVIQWIYDLNESDPSEMLQLQPGNYKVVFRSKNRKETIHTVEKNFKIVSDGSVSVNLY